MMPTRQFTIDEVLTELRGAWETTRLLDCIKGLGLQGVIAHETELLEMELAHDLRARLESLPAPDEYERKVWGHISVKEQRAQREGDTFDGLATSASRTPTCTWPLTMIYREGHE